MSISVNGWYRTPDTKTEEIKQSTNQARSCEPIHWYFRAVQTSTLLLETLLNDVAVERVAVRGKEAALHERRRVVNLVFLRLY